jgi:hypothetical protein
VVFLLPVCSFICTNSIQNMIDKKEHFLMYLYFCVAMNIFRPVQRTSVRQYKNIIFPKGMVSQDFWLKFFFHKSSS